jgi:hypothetical protein
MHFLACVRRRILESGKHERGFIMTLRSGQYLILLAAVAVLFGLLVDPLLTFDLTLALLFVVAIVFFFNNWGRHAPQ